MGAKHVLLSVLGMSPTPWRTLGLSVSWVGLFPDRKFLGGCLGKQREVRAVNGQSSFLWERGRSVHCVNKQPATEPRWDKRPFGARREERKSGVPRFRHPGCPGNKALTIKEAFGVSS